MPRGICWILAVVVSLGSVAHAEKLSAPFQYEDFSQPEFSSSETNSVYVALEDGEQMAVDIHLPKEGPSRKAFPVIVEYVPYQRSTIDPATGKVSDASTNKEGKFYLSHGYALVVADMRGTGASSGWMMDFMPQLARDGKTLIEWIADQPWCDGNIGMKGSSYLGWSQLATASLKPRGLKCIVPQCVPLDGYTGEAYPGGIFLQGFFDRFTPFMGLITRNFSMSDMGVKPTKPAVDEDGDGEWLDEIPVDKNGNGTFLDDGAPAYPDGIARKDNFYYKATAAHANNHDYTEWASAGGFLDSKSPLGDTLYELSPSAFVPGLMESKIPMYHVGGWFDAFARGSAELYATMARSNPSRLVFAPSYHDFPSGPMWKHFGVEDVEKLYVTEHVRFFDHYLKGVDNGIDREDPVVIFVMNGEGWRTEKEWPLTRAVDTSYAFAAEGKLSNQVGAAGSDEYTVDATHNSGYQSNKGNRYLGITMESPDGPPYRSPAQAVQSQGYTSTELEADTEVTGHPMVHLWVSATAPDLDFFVYLEDYAPDGSVLLVTEGQLRAGFAGLSDNDHMVLRGEKGIDVEPELPWHGFEKKDYNPQVFASGKPVELVIDFNPTSWVFKAGHRIRVSIACADYPTFRLHPNLSPDNDPTKIEGDPPVVTFHHGGDTPARVVLPVVK